MLEDPENPSWTDVSVEFCGGTHLSNTKEAETFSLLEEVGVCLDFLDPGDFEQWTGNSSAHV